LLLFHTQKSKEVNFTHKNQGSREHPKTTHNNNNNNNKKQEGQFCNNSAVCQYFILIPSKFGFAVRSGIFDCNSGILSLCSSDTIYLTAFYVHLINEK
jgi:hypothetical protein